MDQGHKYLVTCVALNISPAERSRWQLGQTQGRQGTMWTQGKTVAELRQYAANGNISKQARAQALREINRRIARVSNHKVKGGKK